MKKIKITKNQMLAFIVFALTLIAFTLGIYLKDLEHINNLEKSYEHTIAYSEERYFDQDYTNALSEITKATEILEELKPKYSRWLRKHEYYNKKVQLLRMKALALNNCISCTNNYGEALRAIDDAISLLDTGEVPATAYTQFYEVKGEIYLSLEDSRNVHIYADQLIDIGDGASGHIMKAQAFMIDGNYAAAKDYVEKAKNIDSDNPAISVLERTIRKKLENPEAMTNSEKETTTTNTPPTTGSTLTEYSVEQELAYVISNINSGIFWFNHSINFLNTLFCTSGEINDSTYREGSEYFESADTRIRKLKATSGLTVAQQKKLYILESVTDRNKALIEKDLHSCREYGKNKDIEAFNQDIEYHNNEIKALEKIMSEL